MGQGEAEPLKRRKGGNPNMIKGAPSVNPRGRGLSKAKCVGHKTYAEFSAACCSFTGEALETLVEVMRSKAAGPAMRIKAAGLILERAHGKVPEIKEVNVTTRFAQMSDQELVAYIMGEAEAMKLVEGEEATPVAGDVVEASVEASEGDIGHEQHSETVRTDDSAAGSEAEGPGSGGEPEGLGDEDA